jgi:putative spermidine/putrescine transport system ATP-binding protein
MAANDAVVVLDRLSKTYGDVVAVAKISLSVHAGELVCLLGPSGCGKTTTLKMVAGFIQPTSGCIVLGGTDVTAVPPHKRDTGMVFQNYALFPHLSVAENIAFAPQNIGMSRQDTRKRVAELLDLVQLPELAKRYPNELSGGQQQRVALARALALRPAVLLLDEPLSNLDAKLRLQMRDELRSLVTRLDTTTLFVTHDQEEALAIADRIVVMNRGLVEQVGVPEEIYETPQTRFVAEFIGRCNLLPARILDSGSAVLIGNGIRITVDPPGLPSGSAVAIRPEAVALEANGGANRMKGRITHSVYLGAITHLRLDLDGIELLVEAPSSVGRRVATGEVVDVSINPRDVRILP